MLIKVFLCVFCLLSCLSCSSQDSYKKSFKIAIDSSWRGVKLQGKRINLNNAMNELLDRIEEKEGVVIQRLYPSFDEMWFLLHSGECEGALLSKDPHTPPFGLYEYSPSIFFTGTVLVLPKKAPMNSLKEMENHLVGVLYRSNGAKVLSTQPNIFSRFYEEKSQALEDLLKGKLQGMLMERFPAQAYCRGLYQKELRYVNTPLTQEGVRLCVLKKTENKPLLTLFNRGMQALEKEGSLKQIFIKWGVAYEEKTL